MINDKQKGTVMTTTQMNYVTEQMKIFVDNSNKKGTKISSETMKSVYAALLIAAKNFY